MVSIQSLGGLGDQGILGGDKTGGLWLQRCSGPSPVRLRKGGRGESKSSMWRGNLSLQKNWPRLQIVNPVALKLRFPQTLTEVTTEKI